MPDLSNIIRGNDPGFIQTIANAWGIELSSSDLVTALPDLIETMQNQNLVNEILESLPDEARYALNLLLDHQGKMLWAQFCRRFGELRPMGAAKRDRERPDLNPDSTTEILWYKALIGKAFFNLPPEPQEYAYIPEDIIEFLPNFQKDTASPSGRPASPGESSFHIPATDQILDETCSLLAALRMQIAPNRLDSYKWQIPVPVLLELLQCAGITDQKNIPCPDKLREFLEISRGKALLQLAQSWLKSQTFNELRMLPELIFEGEWSNDPLLARQTVIEMLHQLPANKWWSLSGFINAIRDKNPDFQRPAGDYDSWFIRRADSDTYLRGFESWDMIEGALIRFMICGPLHWLGFIDLASAVEGDLPAAFRPSFWAKYLWQDKEPAQIADENANLKVRSNGLILAPNLTPRSVRYQISRFCEWEPPRKNIYYYRLTPASLNHANKQDLKVSQLLSLLKKNASTPLPPNLIKALERWEKKGSQTQIRTVIILQVDSPEMIEVLQKTRAARYLAAPLSPTTIQIKPEGIDAIRNALVEHGYLIDIETRP